MEPIAVKDVVASGLRNLNKKIADEMRGDCIFICADMLPPLDDEFRHVVETIRGGRRTKSAHLIVVLETQGGMLEVAERLVSVMRKHYKKVSFVVPSHAYSAGTVLVMSGDDIHMDYYSVLGRLIRSSMPGMARCCPAAATWRNTRSCSMPSTGRG